MTTTSEVTPPLPPAPLSETQPREVRGGGFILALLAGLGLSASVVLLLFPPVGIAWAVIAGILAGAAIRQARHVITVTVTAVVPPVATSLLATCLTGVWGWLVVGIILATGLLVIATPILFGIGRVLRPRIGGAYPLLAGVLVSGGLLAVLGWLAVMADAINPGTCPPGPGG